MKKIKVHLRPLVVKINLPTVMKTAILQGESTERLFIATQIGEIFYIGNGTVRIFLDIRSQILKLGGSNGYDERGLLGLAFHPQFHSNGLFYLHYSVAGTQGPGALPGHFQPDPCNPATLNLEWLNRETNYDHIDTVEEWILHSNRQAEKRRTLLNIRRPFLNHNGFNSLNFSPETGKLVLTTGDGGSGYDPFNLSQNNMEIAGKIIEMDVNNNLFIDNLPVVTRFDELPVPVQETLTVIAKGVRNIPGISFQRMNDHYIKYTGNVGQDMVESVFSFTGYIPVPVTRIVRSRQAGSAGIPKEFINFGWRGWEGTLPASVIKSCPANPALNEKITAYYDETINTSVLRLPPLTAYYHHDPRPDKFGGTALTGVHPYMGSQIVDLQDSVVFTDLARNEGSKPPVRGVLAYTRPGTDCRLNDFSIIETDYDFGSQSAYYVGLGTNTDQTRLFLGVYGSMKVTDLNQGTIFEVI